MNIGNPILKNEAQLNMSDSDGETEAFENKKDISNDRTTIDLILNKIGYTPYHFIMMLIVGLSLASDGVELYLIYLISPVLKEMYSLTDHQISLVVSSLFLGIGVGAIISGVLINKFGRRLIMIFFLLVISFFGTVCVLIDNIFWFVFCRFLIGISIGILFNLTNALCEILPHKYRDFIMGSIYFYLKLGIVYFVLIFYLFTQKVEPINNYKFIVICASIPIYLCLILAFLFYDESPRILLWSDDPKNIEKGFAVIEKIAQGSNYKLTEKDKKGMLNDIHCLKKINLEKGHDKYDIMKVLCQLFDKKYKKLFLLVIFLWVINITIVFTNLYSLPIMLEHQNLEEKKFSFDTLNANISRYNEFQNNGEHFIKKKSKLRIHFTNESIFEKSNSTHMIFNTTDKDTINDLRIERGKKLRKILISSIIPIPAEFLAGFMTSVPLFGRKYTMTLGFSFEIIFALMMYFQPHYMYIYSSFIIFFNVFSFNICKLYTTEAFNTQFRDTAYGFSNFCSRIASILTTYTSNAALSYSIYGPCFVIAGVSALGVAMSLLLPFDTCSKALDEEYYTEQIRKNEYKNYLHI